MSLTIAGSKGQWNLLNNVERLLQLRLPGNNGRRKYKHRAQRKCTDIIRNSGINTTRAFLLMRVVRTLVTRCVRHARTRNEFFKLITCLAVSRGTSQELCARLNVRLALFSRSKRGNCQ